MLVLKTRRQVLSQVLFSPDGAGLAAAGKLGTFWWKSFRDDPQFRRIGTSECWGIGFPGEGNRLVTGWSEAPAGIRIVTSGDEAPITIPREGFWATTVVVCPNTGTILIDRLGDLDCWVHKPGSPPTERWSVRANWPVFGSRPVFGPDGSWFVRSTGSRFEFCSSDTGGRIKHFEFREWVSCTPVVSPDGEWLAFGSGAQIIMLRGDGTVHPQRLFNDNTHQFTGVAFHPSGKYVAGTNNDQTVKLFDVATRQLVRTFTWEIGRMRCVTFSPDGTLAAAGSDTGKVIVWDVDV